MQWGSCSVHYTITFLPVTFNSATINLLKYFTRFFCFFINFMFNFLKFFLFFLYGQTGVNNTVSDTKCFKNCLTYED